MKTTITLILIFLLTNSTLFSRTHIVLFDCSGSFIGKNAPESLKSGALQIIADIVLNMSASDTLIFIPIRENSTKSSLKQIRLTKLPPKKVFDKTHEKQNIKRMKNFAAKVLKEVNKSPAKSTDIVSAINHAASIAKLGSDNIIWCLSDGDDNVNAKLFNDFKGIHIYHLFIYASNTKKMNDLVTKWKEIYNTNKAKSSKVLDAQSSLNFKVSI